MKKYLLPLVLSIAGIIFVLLHFLVAGGGSGNLDVQIQPTSYIMPAAYKVYANEEALEGRFYLCKLILTNEGGGELKNLKVSYEVPGYINWTEIDKIRCLVPGQSAVLTVYPRFDPSIVEKTSTSKEKGNIRIEYETGKGSDVFDKSFGFEMRGRNDIVYSSMPANEILTYPDMFENIALVPCFITPEDPIIKYYTQQIQQKVLKGEAAAVVKTTEEALRFLMAVYESTRQAGMVYSGTKGIPLNVGDVSSLIQHIRLPREVVTGNTGLCIELSTLYASVLSCAGLEPMIFFIPGHAYPGIKVNNSYYAIEATGIGGEGLGNIMTAEKALEKGMEELKEFIQKLQEGDSRFMYLDVHELNSTGVNPMELKDDSFLRQKVDQIVASWGGDGAKKIAPGVPRTTNYARNEMAHSNQGGGGNYDGGDAGDMLSYGGIVSFRYPSHFMRMDNPAPGFPALVSQLEASDGSSSISVYRVTGTSNPDQAMNYLVQAYYNFGANIQYQNNGSSGNFVRYSGQTSSAGNLFRWVGYFKPSGGNVVGVTVGAPAGYYGQMQGTINQIVSTIR
ncbi:MAG TPA: hypothetical protein PLD74_11695 [Prolixibacteraceae bacterium]|nr:hypothetical protein [Prolixibacteraceae bacterium]HOS91202.1 hypothetical protein [Prolixibacteraceae bacterium]HPL44811.1 hypothetical protein [Prolixibacteraceae bacterium]HQE53013.1 hypothetical protein [Prolixibacteraceae bacterium]HQH76105.1 hypothetical protein [Prolixibacteraceae bacterium]